MKRVLVCFSMIAALICAQDDPATLALELGKVKRIYVDKLTGGEAAAQMRDMLMSGLQGTRLWIITENAEKADAFLRGAADDLIFNESRESNESLNARASLSLREGATSSRNSEGRFSSVGVGQSEGQRSTERKHEASAAMRLVNKDGDLIWSTTKESPGAKFRGPAADVVDKVVKQLAEDFQEIRKMPASKPAN